MLHRNITTLAGMALATGLVLRIAGDDAPSIPGAATQWSAALPSSFGTY